MPTNPNPFLRSPLDLAADKAEQDAAALSPAPQVDQAPAAEIPAIPMPDRTPVQGVPAPAAAPAAAANSTLAPPPEMRDVFEASAKQYNVPVNVLMALAHQESRYDATAIGKEPTKYGRAKGIMQYLDSTAESLGINPLDPNQAIPAAAKQIRDRLDKGASMDDAVREHFAGPDRAGWGAKTRAYGDEVLAKAGRIGSELYATAPEGGAPPAPDDADLQVKTSPNNFSSRLGKKEYLATFMELNPNASPGAQKAAMDQYDVDAAARSKAAGNRVQDKFAQMQSPEATFNAKLDAKMNRKSNA